VTDAGSRCFEMKGDPMSPIIRLARNTDAKQIQDCANQAYEPYIPLIGCKPAPMCADFPAQIRKGWVFVIETNVDHPDGYIVLFPKDGAMFIENIAVLPRVKGQGFGGRLMEFADAQARELSLKAVTLYTHEKMTANQALYPHLGFVETARRMEYGFNRVYFQKNLEQIKEQQ
jgi:ribosomal protein S18 acetylase RimI-like enzyme